MYHATKHCSVQNIRSDIFIDDEMIVNPSPLWCTVQDLLRRFWHLHQDAPRGAPAGAPSKKPIFGSHPVAQIIIIIITPRFCA